MAFLRLDAKPADANGAVIPAATPKVSEIKAAQIRSSPYLVISLMLPP